MSRRSLTLIIASVGAAAAIGVSVLIPVPYVILGPGPTLNTLGNDGSGQELITISGHQTYPTSGHLNMVTVSYEGCTGNQFNIFTAISIYGLFLGTGALVMVLSVMSGFEQDLKKKILGTNAHIVVTEPDTQFTDYREIRDRIARVPGVIGASPYLENEVMIASPSNLSMAMAISSSQIRSRASLCAVPGSAASNASAQSSGLSQRSDQGVSTFIPSAGRFS